MPEPTETSANVISPEIHEWVSGIDRIGGDVSAIREEVRSAINQALIEAQVSPDELKSKKQMLYNRSTQSTFVELNYTANRESDFKAVFEDIGSGALPERLTAGVNAKIRHVMSRFPSNVSQPESSASAPDTESEVAPDETANDAASSGHPPVSPVPPVPPEVPLSAWGSFKKFLSKFAFWERHGDHHSEHDGQSHAGAHGHGKEHWAVSTVKWPFRTVEKAAGFGNKFFELPVIRAFVYGNEHYILRTKSKKGGGHGDSHGH